MKFTPFFTLETAIFAQSTSIHSHMPSASSSSSNAPLILVLLVLGGVGWMASDMLAPHADRPVPEAPEEATSLPSRALDASQTNGESLNSSMNDQLKSVQNMVGGSYDGKTYVPPTGKK